MHHMTMLKEEHVEKVKAYLSDQPLLNLYARTLAEPSFFRWQLWSCLYESELGEWADDEFESLVFHWPGRYTLPLCKDVRAHGRVAAALSGYKLGVVMGERALCDRVVDMNRSYSVARRFDHQMMTCSRVSEGMECERVDRAERKDLAEIVRKAALMSIEDFGIDPRVDGEDDFVEHVRQRIEDGRTWVVREDDEIVFLAHVGYAQDDAAQLGGTWVVPARRGQGLGTRAVAAIVDKMLATWPRVVLEVNEENTPALRCYEKVGFTSYAPMRFITHRDDTYRVMPELRESTDLEFDRY